jgi:predicted transcriptional regulator
MPSARGRAFLTMSITEDRERLESRLRVVLKASREDLDVSQRELARRMGCTRNMIANLETGRRDIRMSDFLLI